MLPGEPVPQVSVRRVLTRAHQQQIQAHVRAALGHTEVANPDQHVAVWCILGGVSIRPDLGFFGLSVCSVEGSEEPKLFIYRGWYQSQVLRPQRPHLVSQVISRTL